jgi:hypothetical protein
VEKKEMRFKSLILATAMAVCSTVGVAQQVLNNDTIVKMHTSGLGDAIIVSTINSQPGTYVTSAGDLIALKNAGIGDTVIGAMTAKNAGAIQGHTSSSDCKYDCTWTPAPISDQAANQPPATIVKAPTVAATKPRIFLQADSHGNTVNARRDQSMEMSKDFERDCPAVRISIVQQMADYTVVLNHVEYGFVRDNQIQIADKNGDLISKTKEGGSIAGGVKKACDMILTDWGQRTNP